MNIMRMFALGMVLVAVGAGWLPGQTQPADLSGTWVGETQVSGQPNTLTLVLAKKGDVYSGSISDSMGMLVMAPLQNVKFDSEKMTMTFYFMVTTANGDLRVDSTIKVNGGKLAGAWAVESGETGSFELEKKK
jgi:hypothetical protein